MAKPEAAHAGATGACRIRGVISRTQSARQLGRPIPITEVANTFPDVVRMLS